jgi:PAS domain S-box-containing protein
MTPPNILAEPPGGLDGRFCQVMDAAPVMIWVSGGDKLCIWFNRPWLDFTGRAFEQELGNGWAEGVHPDDFDRCLDIYTSRFDAREPFRMQYRLRHHSGHYRWIDDSAIPRTAQDGTFLGYIGSCIDVHESALRLEQEVASRLHTERRLQEALEAGAVMAFEWDVSTDLVRRSNNAAQILGLDPQQTLDGKSFLARVHPDDLGRIKAVLSTRNRDNSTGSITYRFLRLDGREVWFQETTKAEFDDAGRLVRLKGLKVDITERQRAEEHQQILVAELNHRVKNMLARVAAIAENMSQDGVSIDEFIRSYNGRIQSMASAHTLLSQTGWNGASLTAVVRNQLAPYATDANMTIVGTDIILGPRGTQMMAMVLHELVTNAVKHGALSIPGGRVSVTWDRKLNGSAETNLILVWREIGGPPAASEIQSGYGTALIRELIPHELGGNVDLVFASDGACCRIDLPLEV